MADQDMVQILKAAHSAPAGSVTDSVLKPEA
jgi:hypothetical protein